MLNTDRKNYILIIMFLMFSNSIFSQDKNTMAILENKQQMNSIQNDIYHDKIRNSKTYVLYKGKFHKFKDFNIVDTLYKNVKLSFKIINHPDSIKKITPNDIKSIISIK